MLSNKVGLYKKRKGGRFGNTCCLSFTIHVCLAVWVSNYSDGPVDPFGPPWWIPFLGGIFLFRLGSLSFYFLFLPFFNFLKKENTPFSLER